MNDERVLALDISTKTGWSLLLSTMSGFHLECYGKIPKLEEPSGRYPETYVDWAYACYNEILTLIDEHAPDVLVIEETSGGSKSAYSQKILEYIHFLVAKFIKESKIKAVYLLTEQWRREVGCSMSIDEKKRNKEVKKFKEKNNTKVAKNADGKRIGKITRKHVNIRRANEIFGTFLATPLLKKDEDTADSLLLGYCYYLRQVKQNE